MPVQYNVFNLFSSLNIRETGAIAHVSKTTFQVIGSRV